jgi:FKBP-type peptidyl-prolyl cis-trans isomerase
MRRRNKMKGKKLSDRIFLLLAICLAGYVFASKNAENPYPDAIKKEKKILVEEEKGQSLIDHLSASVELKDYPYGTVLDFKQGEGNPVQCGQEIQVRFRTVLLDGTPIEDSLEKGAPVQLKIGESKAVIPGVLQFAMGMRLGGERQVTLPPDVAYDVPEFRRKDVPMGSPVMLRLKIMGVKEDKALMTVKEGHSLFNMVQAASRKQAWCGEEVSVLVHNLTGRNVAEILPSAEGYQTRFKTGARTVPLWLDQAVVGDGSFKPLGLGGYRGVTIKGESDAFKDWDGAAVLKVKAGETNVLRVHVIGVGNETIQIEEPDAEEKVKEGWKHEELEKKTDEAAPEVKPEAEVKSETEVKPEAKATAPAEEEKP